MRLLFLLTPILSILPYVDLQNGKSTDSIKVETGTISSVTKPLGLSEGYYMGHSFMNHVYVHAKDQLLIADFIFFDKAPRTWGIDTLSFHSETNEWKGTFSRLVKKGKHWKIMTTHPPFASNMKLQPDEQAYQQNYRAYRNEELRKKHHATFLSVYGKNPELVGAYENKSAAYQLEKQAADLSVSAFRQLFERFMTGLA